MIALLMFDFFLFIFFQEPSPSMDAYYLPGAAADDLEKVQDTSSRKRKASGDISTLKKSRVR